MYLVDAVRKGTVSLLWEVGESMSTPPRSTLTR